MDNMNHTLGIELNPDLGCFELATGIPGGGALAVLKHSVEHNIHLIQSLFHDNEKRLTTWHRNKFHYAVMAADEADHLVGLLQLCVGNHKNWKMVMQTLGPLVDKVEKMTHELETELN